MDSLSDLTAEQLDKLTLKELNILMVDISIRADNCLAYESCAPLHERMKAKLATQRYMELRAHCRAVIARRKLEKV